MPIKGFDKQTKPDNLLGYCLLIVKKSVDVHP